jgi:hypothetical protein
LPSCQSLTASWRGLGDHALHLLCDRGHPGGPRGRGGAGVESVAGQGDVGGHGAGRSGQGPGRTADSGHGAGRMPGRPARGSRRSTAPVSVGGAGIVSAHRRALVCSGAGGERLGLHRRVRDQASRDSVHGRHLQPRRPLWFYVPVVLVGFFPWSGFFPPRCGARAGRAPPPGRNGRRSPGGDVPCWLTGLVFFSLAGTKLPSYLFPRPGHGTPRWKRNQFQMENRQPRTGPTTEPPIDGRWLPVLRCQLSVERAAVRSGSRA